MTERTVKQEGTTPAERGEIRAVIVEGLKRRVGNNVNSVFVLRVYVDDVCIITMQDVHGYGDVYKMAAMDVLTDLGYVPAMVDEFGLEQSRDFDEAGIAFGYVTFATVREALKREMTEFVAEAQPIVPAAEWCGKKSGK